MIRDVVMYRCEVLSGAAQGAVLARIFPGFECCEVCVQTNPKDIEAFDGFEKVSVHLNIIKDVFDDQTYI